MDFHFGLSFQTGIFISFRSKPHVISFENLNCNYKKYFYKCICFHECITTIKNKTGLEPKKKKLQVLIHRFWEPKLIMCRRVVYHVN